MFNFFLSSFTNLSFIFKPLFAINLLASLFDEIILFFDKKSKKINTFFNSSNFILFLARFKLNPFPSKVSFAVCSAFFDAAFHVEFL